MLYKNHTIVSTFETIGASFQITNQKTEYLDFIQLTLNLFQLLIEDILYHMS